MASPKQLAAIEDWENYKGVDAMTAGENTFGRPLSEPEDSDIKVNLASALLAAPMARATLLPVVFRAWQQRLQDGTGPALLACFFEHKYDGHTFVATSLKDTDAILLQDIAPLAKRYGFDLYLARPTYIQYATLHWYSEGCEPHGITVRRSRYGSPEVDADTDVLRMPAGLEEEYVEVCRQASALDGLPMDITGDATRLYADDLDCDLNEPFVNGFLTHEKKPELARFDPSDEHCGSLLHEYTRHALIITPTNSDAVTVKLGASVGTYAYERLTASTSSAPTVQEMTLTGFLRHALKSHDSLRHNVHQLYTWGISEHEPIIAKILKTLRESAQRWNSVDLFVAVCRDCAIERCAKSMSTDGLIAAYKTFSWAGLKDLYTDIISKTQPHSLCGQLLDKLSLEATGRKDKACIRWCKAHCGPPLDAVQKLEATDSIEWVVNLSVLRDRNFLRNVLLPRFRASNVIDLTLWSSFLKKLHGMPASTKFPAKERSLTIREGLEHLATSVPAYPTKYNPAAEYAHCIGAVEQELLDVEPIVTLFQLGFDLGAPEACMPLLKRMWTERNTQLLSQGWQFAPHKYYSALVDKLAPFVDDAKARTCLQSFFGDSVQVLAQYYTSYRTTIHTALKLTGDPPKAINGLLSPDRINSLNRQTLMGLATFIFSSLRPQAASSKAKAELDALLKRCMNEAINKCRLGASDGGGIDVLELCYTVELPTYVERALLKFGSQNDANHTRSGLMPFLAKELPRFLTNHELEMTMAPFAQFAASVLKASVNVLGPKPEEVVPLDQLKLIPCSGDCLDCEAHLRPFLGSGRRTASVREKQAVRTHIEKRLAKAKAWGFSWETIKVGSPHTLKLTKPEDIIPLAQWAAKQVEGENLLKGLGDESAQRVILGADYAWVTGCIAATCSPTDAPPATTTRGEKRPSDSEAATSNSKKARLSD